MKQLTWFLVLILLYFPVAEIGDYPLTLGGVAALIIAVSRFPYARTDVVLSTSALLVLPLLIVGIHIATNSIWTLALEEFTGTFLLWCVSCTLIVGGLCHDGRSPAIPALTILTVLSALGFAQFVLARMFGSVLGYEIVAPLISFDIFDSYLNVYATEFARAIGTYYEPSIFGRVIATLSSILLIQTKRIMLPAAFIVLNTVTTQSLGLLALGLIIFVVWYARFSAAWIPAVLAVTMIGG